MIRRQIFIFLCLNLINLQTLVQFSAKNTLWSIKLQVFNFFVLYHLLINVGWFYCNNYQKQMNFCQSHLNHHCVHAHSCTNKQHQKAAKQQQKKKHSVQRNKNSQENLSKSQKEKCEFRNQIKSNDQSLKTEHMFKLLQQKQLELKQMKSKNNQLQGKLSKEVNQSKNFQSQIEYYRQQFTKLIQNSSLDAKSQIKKRISETGELTIKVKVLQTKNDSLKSEVNELKKSKQSKQHLCQRLKRQNDQFQQKNQTLRLKLKDLEQQKNELKEYGSQKSRQSDKNEEKWKILISQLKQRCQSMQRQKNSIEGELNNIKQQKNILQKKYRNERQIHQMQTEKLLRQSQRYNLMLNERQKHIKDLSQNLKLANQNNTLLQQDLKHTKNCFQFTKAEANRNKQAQKIQSPLLNDRNIVVNQDHDRYSNKENVSQTQNQRLLKKQIAELKAVIKGLQQKSMTNIEEVILKIGASEAFKRLIDQKNEIIKKLMREKAQIKSIAILSNN